MKIRVLSLVTRKLNDSCATSTVTGHRFDRAVFALLEGLGDSGVAVYGWAYFSGHHTADDARRIARRKSEASAYYAEEAATLRKTSEEWLLLCQENSHLLAEPLPGIDYALREIARKNRFNQTRRARRREHIRRVVDAFNLEREATKGITWGELTDGVDLGSRQQYITNGHFGVIGTPGDADWRVVEARDGQFVVHSYNQRTQYEQARELAEYLQHDVESST